MQQQEQQQQLVTRAIGTLLFEGKFKVTEVFATATGLTTASPDKPVFCAVETIEDCKNGDRHRDECADITMDIIAELLLPKPGETYTVKLVDGLLLPANVYTEHSVGLSTSGVPALVDAREKEEYIMRGQVIQKLQHSVTISADGLLFHLNLPLVKSSGGIVEHADASSCFKQLRSVDPEVSTTVVRLRMLQDDQRVFVMLSRVMALKLPTSH